jgi:hypothetical protein
VIAALLAVDVGPAAAEVVTLTADRDNTLFQDATGSLSNGAGPAVFAGRNSQSLLRRTLVRFDVAGSIPSGATISNVVLTLHVSNVSDVTPRIFTIHRVQRDWGEGTSTSTGGGGAPATTGDATWLCSFYPGIPWTQAGGDFEPIADASQLLGDVGSYSWSAPPMVSDVQAWRNGVVANCGWIILGDETAEGTARRFDSRESTDPANRPTLTVTYSVTTGVENEGVIGNIALFPCRPNPGSGPMRLQFSLPASARVALVVHDVRGRRIWTMADRTFPQGLHEVLWEESQLDGATIGSGLYFVTLSMNGRPVTTQRWVRLE